MARLQWALTCKDISIDSSTNNITYRDAIEQLRVREFPAELPPLIIIAVLWRRDEIDTSEIIEYRVRLEDTDREQLGWTDPQEVDLENYERYRAGIQNPPMTIEEPGTIWFVVEKNEGDDWEEVWDLPVEIKQLEEEPPAVQESEEMEATEAT